MVVFLCCLPIKKSCDVFPNLKKTLAFADSPVGRLAPQASQSSALAGFSKVHPGRRQLLIVDLVLEQLEQQLTLSSSAYPHPTSRFPSCFKIVIGIGSRFGIFPTVNSKCPSTASPLATARGPRCWPWGRCRWGWLNRPRWQAVRGMPRLRMGA